MEFLHVLRTVAFLSQERVPTAGAFPVETPLPLRSREREPPLPPAGSP